MESRMHEDYGVKSSLPARLRNQQIQRVPDPYLMSGHDVMGRSPRLPRSMSPARRVVGSGLLERRGYGWEVDGGTGKGERMRFRSPSPTFVERLPNYEKGFLNRDELRRRYEFADFVERNYELDNGLKHSGIRGNAERDRVLATGGNQALSEKRVALEDGRIAREAYKSVAELEPALRRADGAVNLPLSSRNPDIRFKDVLYPDPYLLEKLTAMERYGKGEKYTLQSKDLSYSGSTTLNKDFCDTAGLTEFAGTSLQSSRENIMVSYRDGMPLAGEVYARSSVQQIEEFSPFEHHQRHSSETGGDPESSRKDVIGYWRGTFSPSRAEDREYLYPRPQIGNTDYSYPSENLGSKMSSVNHPEDYNEGDFITPDLMEFTEEHMSKAEYSQRLHRSRGSWNHLSLQDQSFSGYFPANRGRILADKDGAHRERPRKSPHNPHDMGAHRNDLKKKGTRSYEVDTCNRLEGSIKRKYGVDEELIRHSTRGTMSSKTNNDHIVMARKERFEWNDEDDIDLLLPNSSEYYHDTHRRATKAFDVVQHDAVSTCDDWLSYCDPEDYVQEHSTKLIKPGKRNLKGHSRPGLSNGYDSYSFRKPHLRKNVLLRGKDDKQLGECATDAQELDNLPCSFKSGPTEDSEEFKQMVNTFFLAFSKKLNASPATQKRYKEQGRAGPLFCIVCGQSVSKEFKDTKGLVIHCYMSQKAGLRARHLGLHKAICVLLGWESEVAPDVTTPVPQAVSVSEALSQKEDLILWPPIVVIHYISMLASCPGAQKVFTKEAVEDFLRGKGFSVGKIKVSLGMSANNSVMLVKFLGTFSGLQDAEKLHKYFMHDKRGRTDLEQITFIKGKVSNSKEGRMQGEKLEETVLYGYIGIAEDLDKVDYDTKRRCLIKSKKEIQDFANAPV